MGKKRKQSKQDISMSDLSPTKMAAGNTTQGNLDSYLVKDGQKQTNSDVIIEILKKIESMQKSQDANYASQTLLLNNILSDQNKTIDDFKTALNSQSEYIKSLKAVNSKWSERCEMLEGRMLRREKEIIDLREDLLTLQTRSMKNSLIIDGISESMVEGSNRPREEHIHETERKVKFFMKDNLLIPQESIEKIGLDKCIRLGKFDSSKTRKILVNFISTKGKAIIYSNVAKLANTHYSVSDHYPPEIVERRKSLYPVMKQAREDGKAAKMVGDKLFINDMKNGEFSTINLNKTRKHFICKCILFSYKYTILIPINLKAHQKDYNNLLYINIGL